MSHLCTIWLFKNSIHSCIHVTENAVVSRLWQPGYSYLWPFSMLWYRWTLQLRLCLRPEREFSLLWAVCLGLEQICLRATLHLIKYQSNLCACTLVPFLSSYAEMLIDNQRSNKCLPEFASLWGPILNTSAVLGLVWAMLSFFTLTWEWQSFLFYSFVQSSGIWLWLITLLLLSWKRLLVHPLFDSLLIANGKKT